MIGRLKNLLIPTKLDGAALAQSPDRSAYAQIDLLSRFAEPRSLDDAALQARWSQVLPRSYAESIDLFVKQGWLAQEGDRYHALPAAQPFIALYEERLAKGKRNAMAKVRQALAARDAGEALDIRIRYESSHPLGRADWTGPEPQLSRSSLTRRILFLNHWLLDGLSSETVEWLKLYAAEQHLWETHWRLGSADIPADVQRELAAPGLEMSETLFWKAHALGLYVDNQETWQRCKGGDHVRRIEIVGPGDDATCAACREHLGREYLVARVPELPHRACTSIYGCRCRYEPVLESYDDAS